MEEENKDKDVYDLLCEEVPKSIKTLLNDEGIKKENIEYYGGLVDIYKDLKNVEYWKRKENYFMYNGMYGNYGNYGNYGGRRAGYDSYGRGDSYGDNYGRRGYDAKYRGESALEAMHGNYRAYSAGRESYNAGNYGARDDSMKSLRYMLESAVDFFRMLKAEANSQEELTLIHDYVSKINEM